MVSIYTLKSLTIGTQTTYRETSVSGSVRHNRLHTVKPVYWVLVDTQTTYRETSVLVVTDTQTTYRETTVVGTYRHTDYIP